MGNYKSLSPCPEIDLRAKKQYRSIAPCQTTFRDGSYSLYHTSKRRYLDVVEITIDVCNIDLLDNDHKPAFHWAAESGQIQ